MQDIVLSYDYVATFALCTIFNNDVLVVHISQISLQNVTKAIIKLLLHDSVVMDSIEPHYKDMYRLWSQILYTKHYSRNEELSIQDVLHYPKGCLSVAFIDVTWSIGTELPATLQDTCRIQTLCKYRRSGMVDCRRLWFKQYP